MILVNVDRDSYLRTEFSGIARMPNNVRECFFFDNPHDNSKNHRNNRLPAPRSKS